MTPIERMVKDLGRVEAFHGRVYPVVAPLERGLAPGEHADPDRGEWPICVWGRSGGSAQTLVGGDGVKMPLVQVDVLGTRYGVVASAMEEAVAVLGTWLTPEPPSDRWDEVLSVYRQSIVVALEPE